MQILLVINGMVVQQKLESIITYVHMHVTYTHYTIYVNHFDTLVGYPSFFSLFSSYRNKMVVCSQI